MADLSSLKHHWRAGTFGDAFVSRIRRRMNVAERVRWFGTDSKPEAVKALTLWGVRAADSADGRSAILSLGPGDDFHSLLNGSLRRAGLECKSMDLRQALELPDEEVASCAIVLCAYTNAREQTAAVRAFSNDPRWGQVRFEYAPGLDCSRRIFEEFDEYSETDFVSPVLLDDPTPYEIYTQSLNHFRQKCGLRDYLDLYQVIAGIVRNNVPGNIAEFGSYEGHSGWLIARSLWALGSDKHLYMFDTFEEFPEESQGVDQFWSSSHRVDFDGIREKFVDMPNVSLVKGDFTHTLPESGLSEFALAYVDCDSYRATRWLIGTLWPAAFPSGGAMVFEDYGHQALLGNRAAIHEELDNDNKGIHFFSQFSGLYMVYRR